MSSPRERQLAEGLKNKLVGIQKSREIYKNLSKWQRKTLVLDEREKVRFATSVANQTERYVEGIEEKTGAPPTPEQVMEKISELLERL